MRPVFFVLASLWALTLSTPALAADADAGDPFGMLPLVDEVDVANAADAHPFHEDPAGASSVVDLLGRKARAMSIADSAQVFAYKLGAGKGLVAGEAYLLAVDYPEEPGGRSSSSTAARTPRAPSPPARPSATRASRTRTPRPSR